MQDTDKDQNARIQARGMLTGRRIAVTGGAGAIGAAIARRQSIAFFANPREDMSIECIPTCIPRTTRTGIRRCRRGLTA